VDIGLAGHTYFKYS